MKMTDAKLLFVLYIYVYFFVTEGNEILNVVKSLHVSSTCSTD